MKTFIFAAIITAVVPSAFAQTHLLKCESSNAPGAKVKSLVLEKNYGPGFTARMESSFEDGLVTIDIPTSTETPASTQYVLKEDHDLLMTLATYGSQAVVFYQSTDGSSDHVDVEFLKCD